MYEMPNRSTPSITLPLPEDFNFDVNLQYLSRASGECLFRVAEGRLYRALAVQQETPVVEISVEADRKMIVRFLGASAPPGLEVQASVAAYIREWFDLERNLQPFYEMAAADALLQQPAEAFRGLRNIGVPDFFEAICWAIIGQQINLEFAYTLKRRFVENFGRSVDCENERYWLFPSPQVVAGLTAQDIAALRMTRRKSEYLIHVAQLIAEGKLSKHALQHGSYKDAERMLTSIRGIGPWTANYVLMRCLRFPEAWPAGDAGLHRALKVAMNTPEAPNKDEIASLFAKWSGWESYATFYLWRLLY